MIPLGLKRYVDVTMVASEEIYGKFKDFFQIISKHEVYTIPIKSEIVDE